MVKRETLKIYDIQPPKSILDLGLRHQEQISLLGKVQSALLAEQSASIDLLRLLQDNISDEVKKTKVQRLYDYLQNNLAYLVNYDERDKAGKPYTTQVA